MHKLTVLPVYWGIRDDATVAGLTALTDQLRTYWSQQSGGGIDITSTVRDWKQIAAPSGCDTNGLRTSALAANAMAAPGNLNAHVLIHFPQRSGCAWAGLANVLGSTIWVNGYQLVDVFAHEFGHNLGLGHANTLTCTRSGTRVPYIPDAAGGQCSVSEYRDNADVMGYANWIDTGNLNSAFAAYLGLAQVVTGSPGAPTTVGLAPLAQTGSLRAVRIPVTDGTVYVDFRPGVGRDVRHLDWAGVQVHLRTNTNPPSTQLLDMQPDLSAAFTSANLPPWAVWPVPGTGRAVKVTAVSDSAAQVTVVPTAGDTTAPGRVTPSSPTAGAQVVPGTAVTWPAGSDSGTDLASYTVLLDGTRRAFLPSRRPGNTAPGTAVAFMAVPNSTTPATIVSPAASAYVKAPLGVTWTVPTSAAAAVLLDGNLAATVAAGTTTAVLPTVGDGTRTLAVRTLNAAGATLAMSPTVTVVGDSTAPTAPTGLSHSGSILSWTASTDTGSRVASHLVGLDGITLASTTPPGSRWPSPPAPTPRRWSRGKPTARPPSRWPR